jgi:chemotaxis protein methyltransferase CheR
MSWTNPAYGAVAGLLGLRTGLAFAPDRRPGAELGIRRAMHRAGVADPERYRRLVERDEALFDDLVGELTIGETYFFREPGQFQLLRQTILPEFRRRWGDEHILRAWSAGCASGEEAYSLAIVFAEEGLADRAHLLATDVSPAALAKARRATYASWSLRGTGAAAALPHLERHGNRFVVKDAIRRRVAFEQLNLALDVYPSHTTGTCGLDLIFCRNVLIYFDHETIRAVVGRLFAALAEGGWLIAASSDPPLSAEAPFETVVTDLGVFYRKPVGNVAPGRAMMPPAPAGRCSLPPPEKPLALSFEPRPSPAITKVADAPSDPAPAPGASVSVSVSVSVSLNVEEVLGAARDDLAAGRYALAAERTRAHTDLADAAALRVRALANLDPAEADRACAEAIERHPLSSELHYLRAVLLHGLGSDIEAARAARRVLFLDRSLAIAHFLLGTIQRRRGDRAGAWRSFRNARDLCAARPGSEVVALTDDEPAGRLAEAAALQMARLVPAEEPP